MFEAARLSLNDRFCELKYKDLLDYYCITGIRFQEINFQGSSKICKENSEIYCPFSIYIITVSVVCLSCRQLKDLVNSSFG